MTDPRDYRFHFYVDDDRNAMAILAAALHHYYPVKEDR